MNLTWIIKEHPTLTIFTAWNQPFTSNNTSFNGIEIVQFSGEPEPTIRYLTTSQSIGINAYKNGAWINEAYRTVTFTSQPTNTTLRLWLGANAEKLKTPYEYIIVNDNKVQVESAIRDGNGKVIAESYQTKISSIRITDYTTSIYTGTKGTYRQTAVTADSIYPSSQYVSPANFTTLMFDYSSLYSIENELVEGASYLLTILLGNTTFTFIGTYTLDTTTSYSHTSKPTAIFIGGTITSGTGDFERLRNKPPTPPTKLSQLTNDTGYITASNLQYNQVVDSIESILNPINNGNYTVLNSLSYDTPTIATQSYQCWGERNAKIVTNESNSVYVRVSGWYTLNYTTDPTWETYYNCNISYIGSTPSYVDWCQIIYNKGVFFAIDGDSTTSSSWYAISTDGINFVAKTFYSEAPITALKCIDDWIVGTTTIGIQSGSYEGYYRAFGYCDGTFRTQEYSGFGKDLDGETNIPNIYDFNMINNRLILLTGGNRNKDERITRLLVSTEITGKFSLYCFSYPEFNITERNIYYNNPINTSSNKYLLNIKGRCVILSTNINNTFYCLSTDGKTFDSTTTWTEDYTLPNSIIKGAYYTKGSLLFVIASTETANQLSIIFTTDVASETAYKVLQTYSDKLYNNLSLAPVNKQGDLTCIAYNSSKSNNYLITIPAGAYKTKPYVYTNSEFIASHTDIDIQSATSAEIDALFPVIL